MPVVFSTYTKNLFVSQNGKICKMEDGIICSGKDIDYTVNRLCDGSFYRYTDNIKNGYIVTNDGIRAGIYGEAIYQNRKLSVVNSFCGVNLRIPYRFKSCADVIINKFYSDGIHSTLIYSPPGVGKTTLIRELALKLSKKFCVCVVDEKCEILPCGFEYGGGMCDILRGYSKPDGMEIAVRTLSPQLIICDEIGMTDDIPAILSVQNSGVPLIATAHGDSIKAIMRKPNLKTLCDNGIFERFVRLSKGSSGMEMCEEIV
ncbi:MAG: hypothetical protein IJO74_04025 [Clostridia bacterium]|nr:hypothetical protein [Clostridia bacterium]